MTRHQEMMAWVLLFKSIVLAYAVDGSKTYEINKDFLQ